MLRKGERVKSINISLNKQGELPWINIFIEGIEVDEDNNIVAVVPDIKQINKRADEIGLMMTEFTDPVTSQTSTVSGFGAQELIRQLCITLINEKLGTVLDKNVGLGKAMYP